MHLSWSFWLGSALLLFALPVYACLFNTRARNRWPRLQIASAISCGLSVIADVVLHDGLAAVVWVVLTALFSLTAWVDRHA